MVQKRECGIPTCEGTNKESSGKMRADMCVICEEDRVDNKN